MGDITPNDAARAPQWRVLYQSAMLELDLAKLPERIVAARSAVLDRIADGFSKPSDCEQIALRDALEGLRALQTVAAREQRKTGT
jgi:hypothetical protein